MAPEELPSRHQLVSENAALREELRQAKATRDRAISDREATTLAALALLEDMRRERDQARAELRNLREGVIRATAHISSHKGGRVPFGYRLNEAHQLIPIPEQQPLIRSMAELRAEGKSFREISAILAERGIKLSHVSVRRVLATVDPDGNAT